VLEPDNDEVVGVAHDDDIARMWAIRLRFRGQETRDGRRQQQRRGNTGDVGAPKQ
jgi:hypothetical protein